MIELVKMETFGAALVRVRNITPEAVIAIVKVNSATEKLSSGPEYE